MALTGWLESTLIKANFFKKIGSPGHMTRKKKTEAKAKKMRMRIFGSVISAMTMAMIPAAGMAAMSVAEQHYVFKMDITQDVSARTFVIGEFVKAKELRPPAAIPVAEKNKMLLSLRTRETDDAGEKQIRAAHALVSPVLFELASSSLAERTEEELLAALEKRTDKKTPLQITGYTCDLGSQQVNDDLAMKRATTVAELLRAHGFRVGAVHGKGKQGYVSSDPAMRHLNRRVEIVIPSRSAREER
ncbi:MAG: OmpA family protein [Thermodesulfobacteriota bacterium]